jgi:hypothetical protein
MDAISDVSICYFRFPSGRTNSSLYPGLLGADYQGLALWSLRIALMITQPGPCVFALWSLCNKQPWDSKTAFTPLVHREHDAGVSDGISKYQSTVKCPSWHTCMQRATERDSLLAEQGSLTHSLYPYSLQLDNGSIQAVQGHRLACSSKGEAGYRPQ